MKTNKNEMTETQVGISKLSEEYELNHSFVGYVKNYNGAITEFPLGWRPEPHNGGQRTIEWFENPASDKKGYTKTLEMKKGKPNTAVIIYRPIDPMGINSPSSLYDEWKLQGKA